MNFSKQFLNLPSCRAGYRAVLKALTEALIFWLSILSNVDSSFFIRFSVGNIHFPPNFLTHCNVAPLILSPSLTPLFLTHPLCSRNIEKRPWLRRGRSQLLSLSCPRFTDVASPASRQVDYLSLSQFLPPNYSVFTFTLVLNCIHSMFPIHVWNRVRDILDTWSWLRQGGQVWEQLCSPWESNSDTKGPRTPDH